MKFLHCDLAPWVDWGHVSLVPQLPYRSATITAIGRFVRVIRKLESLAVINVPFGPWRLCYSSVWLAAPQD